MQTILIATDLTSRSEQATGRAIALALESGANLHVFHAQPPLGAGVDRDEIESVLRIRFKSRPEIPDNASVETSIRWNGQSVSDAILEHARQIRPDLIVLGGHEDLRLRDAIFGTIAGHVVRRAEAPVLVAQTDHDRPYARIMAAIETDGADVVLATAMRMASARHLFVVHVLDGGEESFIDEGGGSLLKRARPEHGMMLRLVKEMLAEADACAAVRLQEVDERGDMLGSIMRAWAEVDPDLLVMGTHGRTGLARLFQPSNAEIALLGCPSDVLVVPTRRS